MTATKKRKLRWGFKTEADEISREIRSELSLPYSAPLSPWKLAEHLEIPILKMTQLGKQASSSVDYLRYVDQSAFSAATVFDGSRRTIVHNDSHTRGRQANNLSHEIAHGLLLHPATPAIDDKGCRFWDNEIEEEAKWLGSVLLVPVEATQEIVGLGLSVDAAALEYGTSNSNMTYRLRMTAAYVRLERSLKHRKGT